MLSSLTSFPSVDKSALICDICDTCRAIASRLAVALCEGWLAKAANPRFSQPFRVTSRWFPFCTSANGQK
jgi:hypothetical protein